jgi:plastocyanin
MRRPVTFVAALLLSAASLVALAPAASAADEEVSIHDLSYDPATLNIHVGDSVTWYNDEDVVAHTVTSDAGSGQQFNSGTLQAGEEFSRPFTTPGSFAYHCNIHSAMHGTIVVQQVTTTSGAATTSTTTASGGTTTTVAAVTTTSTTRATTGATRVGAISNTPPTTIATLAATRATTANTGSSTGPEVAVAAAAILGGVVLMVMARRPRWGYSLWR